MINKLASLGQLRRSSKFNPHRVLRTFGMVPQLSYLGNGRIYTNTYEYIFAQAGVVDCSFRRPCFHVISVNVAFVFRFGDECYACMELSPYKQLNFSFSQNSTLNPLVLSFFLSFVGVSFLIFMSQDSVREIVSISPTGKRFSFATPKLGSIFNQIYSGQFKSVQLNVWSKLFPVFLFFFYFFFYLTCIHQT